MSDCSGSVALLELHPIRFCFLYSAVFSCVCVDSGAAHSCMPRMVSVRHVASSLFGNFALLAISTDSDQPIHVRV